MPETAQPRRTTGETASAQEHLELAEALTESARASKRPTWAVVVLTLALALVSPVGTYFINTYRLDQIEKHQVEHEISAEKRREVVDTRFASVELAQRAAERDHDHRLTQLEDHWSEVLKRLERIETKLDERRPH